MVSALVRDAVAAAAAATATATTIAFACFVLPCYLLVFCLSFDSVASARLGCMNFASDAASIACFDCNVVRLLLVRSYCCCCCWYCSQFLFKTHWIEWPLAVPASTEHLWNSAYTKTKTNANNSEICALRQKKAQSHRKIVHVHDDKDHTCQTLWHTLAHTSIHRIEKGG